MRTMLARISERSGEQVEVRGWVHRVRELGKIRFILLRDRSGIAQLVVDSGCGSDQLDLGASQLTLESVIAIRGTVAENHKAPGGFEIQVRELEVLAHAEADLPLAVNQQPDKISLDAILDHRMISLRNPKILSCPPAVTSQPSGVSANVVTSSIVTVTSHRFRCFSIRPARASPLIPSGNPG